MGGHLLYCYSRPAHHRIISWQPILGRLHTPSYPCAELSSHSPSSSDQCLSYSAASGVYSPGLGGNNTQIIIIILSLPLSLSAPSSFSSWESELLEIATTSVTLCLCVWASQSVRKSLTRWQWTCSKETRHCFCASQSINVLYFYLSPFTPHLCRWCSYITTILNEKAFSASAQIILVSVV